jgi:hypothetical protein
MSHETTKRSMGGTLVLLSVAAALWLAVLAVLVLVVPVFERTFREQNLRLAAPTQWTVAAGHFPLPIAPSRSATSFL